MRRQNEIRPLQMAQENMILGWRLASKDIEDRAGNGSIFKRIDKIVFVDQPASRGVDQDGAVGFGQPADEIGLSGMPVAGAKALSLV